jgi:hypothetical protein
MSDWLDEFAEALEAAGTSAGVAVEERNLLLRLARDVAHATERKNAPLATYMVGRFVGARGGAGSLQDALEIARSLLPDVEAD